MIVQLDSYKASTRPYLFKTGSFIRNAQGLGLVEAMWFRKTEGALTVSLGRVGEYMPYANSFEDFLEQFRYGRYGGTAQVKFDGEYYWTLRPMNLTDKEKKFLSDARKKFPKIPKGWTGWYDIRER